MFRLAPDFAHPVAPTSWARVTWTSLRNNSKYLPQERTKKMAPTSKALTDVKESTAIDVQLPYPNVEASVQNAVLCVSGLVDRARLAGISVSLVVSQGISVRLLTRDWKLVMTTKTETRSTLIQMVWLIAVIFVTSYITYEVKGTTKASRLGCSASHT